MSLTINHNKSVQTRFADQLRINLRRANVGTAVVLFPILKRQNEALALGYVSARLVECTFIAIGIVSLLAIVMLRQDLAQLVAEIQVRS